MRVLLHRKVSVGGNTKSYRKIEGETKVTLRQKQSKFALMVAILIRHAHALGYEITFGCARCVQEGHHRPNSLHYIGLAIDLNLFKGGKYLTDGSGHDVLHDFWDTIGGAERIEGDCNHYSVVHNGRR